MGVVLGRRKAKLEMIMVVYGYSSGIALDTAEESLMDKGERRTEPGSK